MKRLIIPLVLLGAACTNTTKPPERMQIFEDRFVGKHTDLAHCVTRNLQQDSRWPMRMLQFRSRTYQDIRASEIIGYDTRLLRGIYARSSPRNPDAVMDYIYPGWERVDSYDENDRAYTNPAYRFSMLLKTTDPTHIRATLTGDRHLGHMAWKSLEACARSN